MRITKYGVALLAIVLIGLFLRVYQLGTQSIWLDEAWSVWMSKMSVPQLVATAARADTHPPLYSLILHYWISLFGTSELAVRLLPAVFGVLAIPVTYMVGRQLFDKEVGLVGALILALSLFNIQYSQESRTYSLMVLLTLLSIYFFLRFLQRSTVVSSAGYVLFTTLLVYTHLYGLFVVIAQNIYIVSVTLLLKRRTYRLGHWATLQVIVAALFAPWVVVWVERIWRYGATVVGTTAPPTIAEITHTFITYSGGSWALLLLFTVLSVLSLFAYQKVRGSMDWKAPLKALEGYLWEVRMLDPAPVYFLAVWLITVNLVPVIVSRFSAGIYVAKYTIAASVALYLLVAKGITNIKLKHTKLAVIGIVVILSAAHMQVYYTSATKPQTREATSLIDANFKSGDVVLVYSYLDLLNFYYYNNRTDVTAKQVDAWVANEPTNFSGPVIISGDRSEEQMHELQSAVNGAVNGHDRVWLLYPTVYFAEAARPILEILNESYAESYAKNFYGYDVYLYEKRA
jgi:uncharacterized membrane protein